MKLDEEDSGKILDVPIIGVRSGLKQQPLVEFKINASMIHVTSITGV